MLQNFERFIFVCIVRALDQLHMEKTIKILQIFHSQKVHALHPRQLDLDVKLTSSTKSSHLRNGRGEDPGSGWLHYPPNTLSLGGRLNRHARSLFPFDFAGLPRVANVNSRILLGSFQNHF